MDPRLSRSCLWAFHGETDALSSNRGGPWTAAADSEVAVLSAGGPSRVPLLCDDVSLISSPCDACPLASSIRGSSTAGAWAVLEDADRSIAASPAAMTAAVMS